MAQTAELDTIQTEELRHEIEVVIAKRPEWRFLEQQRHLKDVVRLLLRDLENEKNRLMPAWSNRSLREKALNHCWIGLVISQELNHPPQLTRDIFHQIFYTHLNQHPKVLELAPWTNHSSEAQAIQQSMISFTAELYRLQEMITWDHPWYLTRSFLPFLADRIPKKWIAAVQELMLLLEQHDSLLINNAERQTFQKNDLHSSHPLRKQAMESLKVEQEKYQNFKQTILEIEPLLQLAIKHISVHFPQAYYLPKAIAAAQSAWENADFYLDKPEGQNQNIELKSLLFEEARYQRCCIATRFRDELDAIQHIQNTHQGEDFKSLHCFLQSFFEVKNA